MDDCDVDSGIANVFRCLGRRGEYENLQKTSFNQLREPDVIVIVLCQDDDGYFVAPSNKVFDLFGYDNVDPEPLLEPDRQDRNVQPIGDGWKECKPRNPTGDLAQ